jgi:hypothetical protein
MRGTGRRDAVFQCKCACGAVYVWRGEGVSESKVYTFLLIPISHSFYPLRLTGFIGVFPVLVLTLGIDLFAFIYLSLFPRVRLIMDLCEPLVLLMLGYHSMPEEGLLRGSRRRVLKGRIWVRSRLLRGRGKVGCYGEGRG